MYMHVDPATVPAGTVTFTTVNEGVKKHEFMILSTDVMVADLKVEGDEVVEDDYSVVDEHEHEHLAGGDTASLTADLDPGHYALICNLKGHFRMGCTRTSRSSSSRRSGCERAAVLDTIAKQLRAKPRSSGPGGSPGARGRGAGSRQARLL